jgi:hypothetical protein
MILFEGKEKEVYVDDRIITFAIKMQNELELNQHKGSIFDWNIEQDFQKWLYDFEYHKSKLIASLMAKDNNLKDEFICDLGNYLVALMFQNKINIQKSITLCENEKTKII